MNITRDGDFTNGTELVDPFLATKHPVTTWSPVTYTTYTLTDPLTTERENSEVFKAVIPSGWDLITMATICTNVSCKKAIIHFNETAQAGEDMTGKDASWILTSAVIIFTMQTGNYIKLLHTVLLKLLWGFRLFITSQRSLLQISMKNLLLFSPVITQAISIVIHRRNPAN